MGDHEDAEVKDKVLRDQLQYLRQTLGDPSRYLPYLEQGGVLDSHDKASIRSKPTSREKLESFLELLIQGRKNVSTFDVFVAALLEERVQSQVARKLHRTLEYEKAAMRNIDAIVAEDNGVQYISDIVGDQFSKDDMVEAIKHCNMDAVAALNHLMEKAAVDVSTPVRSSHDPTITQSQLTPRTSYVPTNTTYTAVPSMKEHHVQCATKQSSNVVTSSSQCRPVVKVSTLLPPINNDSTTPNTLLCPFADPRWNVTVLSQKFDHNGGTLHISDHDIDIIIPELAISTGDVAEVQAAAILAGPYRMPSGYDPISVTVWVGASYNFNKLIRVSIPHCAVINSPQNIEGLVALTASNKEFTVNTNSKLLAQAVDHSNCYCYEVNNPYCDYYTDCRCGSICLARKLNQPCKLSTMVFCWKPPDYHLTDKISVEFYFCYNLKHSVKSVKKAYESRKSGKPYMSQWTIGIDNSKNQRICLSYSVALIGTPTVTRRLSKQVNIGDLGFQYFQLHVRDFTKREKLSASLPQFNVSFNRGHQSMFKDFSIDFRVEVESDGDVGLQKCFKYSMKILANQRQYANLPSLDHKSDLPTTPVVLDHSQELTRQSSDHTVSTAALSAFIVYAKEEYDLYGEQVLQLSNLLNDCGINCDIDLYHINDNIPDWSFWVGKSVEYYIASERSHVILVCSPTMITTLEERSDNARVEMVGGYIDRLALRHYLEEGAQKFVPLFINDDSLTGCVPASLSGKTCYNFPCDKLTEMPENTTAKQILDHPDFASLRSLVATLTKQQEIPSPVVGGVAQAQPTVRAPHTGANTAAICTADERTNPSGTTDNSQWQLKKASSDHMINTQHVAAIGNHVRENLPSSTATGNVIVNNLIMVQAGNNVSFEQPKCANESDMNTYNCLRPFVTDIANTLDVDTIVLPMVKYGLLTQGQEDYLSNAVHTSTAKRKKLCSIILSLGDSCVKKFLWCLSETSDYDPHNQLLHKIRNYSSTV